MSVVISGSLVLGDVQSGGGVINADNPLIAYNNFVDASNVSATTSATGNLATNLANPSTALKWLAASASPLTDEYITLALNTAELVDYVAIARHNFGTAGITVSLESLDEGSPETWTEIISEFIPADDSAILMRFTPQAVTSLRIKLQPGTTEATAAVVYAGALLVLQRRIFVGHTPIKYGRKSRITNGRSESGDFLGRIVLSEMTSTKVDMQNITGPWYRTYLDPFIQDSKTRPFFFAWRPSSYPSEIGFAWMTNDPQPSNSLPNGMMQISLEMSGIAP